MKRKKNTAEIAKFMIKEPVKSNKERKHNKLIKQKNKHTTKQANKQTNNTPTTLEVKGND